MYDFLDEKQHGKGSYLPSNEILLTQGQWKEKRWVRQAAILSGMHHPHFSSLLGKGFRLLTPLHNTSTSSSQQSSDCKCEKDYFAKPVSAAKHRILQQEKHLVQPCVKVSLGMFSFPVQNFCVLISPELGLICLFGQFSCWVPKPVLSFKDTWLFIAPLSHFLTASRLQGCV